VHNIYREQNPHAIFPYTFFYTTKQLTRYEECKDIISFGIFDCFFRTSRLQQCGKGGYTKTESDDAGKIGSAKKFKIQTSEKKKDIQVQEA
jgi:hypothetical protein